MAEGAITAFEVAFEGFLLCVDVHVLLEVLCQSESLHAEHADMLLGLSVGRDVSSEGEAGGVGLVAASHLAFVWSFHLYGTCEVALMMLLGVGDQEIR